MYLHASSCHQPSSVKGIQKGVALRLRRICSSVEEYNLKSKEYMAYLVARGHSPKDVKSTFETIGKMSRQNARKKRESSNASNAIIFPAQFNPRGPNVTEIIKKHQHLLESNPILNDLFPPRSIIVANKRGNNLKELLLRGDPYNIKPDLLDKREYGYTRCNKKCDSCDNFVSPTTKITCFATGRVWKIRRNSTCSSKNVVYLAVCKNCGKQGVGSTVSWKPRLSNYKSHIKKKVTSCQIVKHFLDECFDTAVPYKYLSFVILDVVNNCDNLSLQEIDHILLEKEKFWIGTLVTQHKGLNASHDWSRNKRAEKPK